MILWETRFDVPLQAGIPEELKLEEEEQVIHTTQFAMDIVGEAEAEYPEMTLVIERDGQLTVETTQIDKERKPEEVATTEEAPVVQPAATEEMPIVQPSDRVAMETTEEAPLVQPDQVAPETTIYEQIPEQPSDILPIDEQSGTISETPYDVSQR